MKGVNPRQAGYYWDGDRLLALHPSKVAKSSTSFAGVKAGMSVLLGGSAILYGM